MTYQRFSLPEPAANRSKLATLAGPRDPSAPLARESHTAKFNNNNNMNTNGLTLSEANSSTEASAATAAPAPAPICADAAIGPAKVANLLHFRSEFAKFKARPHSATRFRHDQACWAAEMFIDEWGALASGFEWTVADVFGRGGLAYWLGVEVVRAVGPDHAITEAGRIFDRSKINGR
jgi:hypothetical protein